MEVVHSTGPGSMMVPRGWKAAIEDQVRRESEEDPEAGAVSELLHATWNLGGCALDKGAAGLCELERLQGGAFDVVSVQELPRGETGWSFTEANGWHFHSHREESSWRGAGVAFRANTWSLMWKRKSDKGVWCRLRRVHDGVQIWFGSFYFSQGATKESHANEVHEFVQALPATTLPLIVGGDANAEIKWGEGRSGDVQPYSAEGKGEYMFGVFRERGVQFTAPSPEQRAVPTSRPRKADATGRQIDGVATRGVRFAVAKIVRNSYMFLGSDHDAVTHRVEIVCDRAARQHVRPRTAPRQVTSRPSMPVTLNQDSMQRLTKAYVSSGYQDPSEVKRLFRDARGSGLPGDHYGEGWRRRGSGGHKKSPRRRAGIEVRSKPSSGKEVWDGGRCPLPLPRRKGSHRIRRYRGSIGRNRFLRFPLRRSNAARISHKPNSQKPCARGS